LNHVNYSWIILFLLKKEYQLEDNNKKAILLLSCPDRIGLVSRISHFIFERGGNIINLNEHVDVNTKSFFIRVAWDMSNFSIPPEEAEEAFLPMAKEFGASFKIRFIEAKLKVAIFVSKYDHCLHEILWRHSRNEFQIDIPLVISNHPDLKPIADLYKIPFHVFPISKENKEEQERKELELLRDHKIDTIVLARYMQILSPQLINAYPKQIINIHHSFLPAFIGGNPYKQAYERGVKIIGATSHYVTEELDEGPIIEQGIIRITHKDKLDDLIRKGRDVERLVLANALHYHSEHRVIVHGNKTVILN
jgi:formyltetrahydrofolate deformylase